jgi:phytoene dehydrogenase-like protein
MTAGNAVVLGAGHNGLVAALTLAQTGRPVVVVDPFDRPGGLAASREFHPGYRDVGLLHDTDTLRRGLIKKLNLSLDFRSTSPVLTAQVEGRGLLLDDTGAEISGADRAAWGDFQAFLKKVRGYVRKLADSAPPAIDQDAKLMPLASRAFGLYRLGKRDRMELLRIAPTCVDDWLSEWFEGPLLKAALAAPGLAGTWMGPRSPGTAATTLLWHCLAGDEIRGGPAELARALVRACGDRGVQIVHARPEALEIEGGQVRGVILESGERLRADTVLSDLDPAHTLLELVAPGLLPLRTEDGVARVRQRGTTARVSLALSSYPEFTCRPVQRFDRVRTGDHPMTLERAFDAVKYRSLPEHPPLDIRFPTASDASLAPEGHHVAQILVQCTPHHLDGGWDDAKREALGDQVVAELARFAPGVTDTVVAREVLTPVDLETMYGLPGGHLYRAEFALDQLWIGRPNLELSRYATPIRGLFLCSSAAHPGGRITCGPGALAAKASLGK